MPLLQPSQIGIREELADYIAIVDQKSTPFVSMSPKGKDLGNMTFSWQVDNYASPQLTGVVDGTDVTVASAANPVANRARFLNYAQAFRRTLRIGFIAQTQNVAGVTDEVANGISKNLIQLKRDMEATFLCTNQAAVVDNGTNAYLTGSLGNWLTTTGSSVGQPTSAFAPASGAVDTTATASLTETTVQNVLTAIYGATGVFRDYDVICGTTLKRAFSNLSAAATTTTANTNTVAATSVRTFNKELSDDIFKSSIDIFEGDFGRFILHPDVFIGGNNAGALSAQAYKGYVIPFDMTEIRYAKLPEVKELPDAGGGPARLVQTIAGLVVKNPNGFGMFNATS
jgi:hypothetical protein